ncbi:MAG TPA: hypothetical protein VF832_04600 [Longimicrobiales bacterium]
MDRLTIERITNPAPRPVRVRPPDELFIDQATFCDLEVFEAQDGQPGLFRLFDRARTRGGADVLRKRFLAPSSDPERIRAVQASLKFMQEHRRAFDALPGQYVMSTFDNYFHWRLAAPVSMHDAAAVVDGVQLLLESYPQYTQISRGARQTARMISAMRRLAFDPAMAQAPGDLGEYLAQVRQTLQRPALAALELEHEDRWGVVRVLAVDRVLRGSEKESIEHLRDLLFQLDALSSMARVTSEYGFVFPEVVDGEPQVAAEGLVHPLVPDAVANPLRLDARSRLFFLTGPNMAGKTTYLRATGIAIYLAHLGMGVPARWFRFAPCDALFTSITLTDNVRAGVSFFEAEALRARAIAAAVAAGKRVIALLDEPFKGTNVKDAMDASRAYLARLATFERSLFLASSHLIELADPLMANGVTACWRFEATESEGHLAFDYVLRDGVSAQRLGMKVLEQKGVFALLDDPEKALEA